MSSQDHPVAVMQIQWVCIHNKQSLEFCFVLFFLRENSLELLPWEDPSPALQAQVALPNTKGLSTPNSWAWRLWDATSCSNPKQRREEWTGYILLYLLWLSMVSLTILFKLIVFSYLHLPCRRNALNCLEWLAHLWLTYLWLAYFNRNLDSRSMELRDNALYQRNVIGSLGHSYTSIASSLDGFFFRGYRND